MRRPRTMESKNQKKFKNAINWNLSQKMITLMITLVESRTFFLLLIYISKNAQKVSKLYNKNWKSSLEIELSRHILFQIKYYSYLWCAKTQLSQMNSAQSTHQLVAMISSEQLLHFKSAALETAGSSAFVASKRNWFSMILSWPEGRLQIVHSIAPEKVIF